MSYQRPGSGSEFPLIAMGAVQFVSTLAALIVFGIGVRFYLQWSVRDTFRDTEPVATERKETRPIIPRQSKPATEPRD